MASQRVAKVTGADVERIVRRDYPADRVREVLAQLEIYGKEDWHPERDRVRAAILKLAAGNPDQIYTHLKTALGDYRDSLVGAEYPNQTNRRFDRLTPDEKQIIVDADWKRYQEWFAR